jgi:hypothetical protein
MWQVFSADGTEVESQAKALIYRNNLAIAIPDGETPADAPAARLIIWSHLGQHLPKFLAVDVTNDVPTERPLPVDPRIVLNVYQDDEGAINLLGDRRLCRTGGCKLELVYSKENPDVKIGWCICAGCPNTSDCECGLFTRALKMSKRGFIGTFAYSWNYAVAQEDIYSSDDSLIFACHCVEKK